MTNRPTKNVAASVAQRLLNYSRTKEEDYNAVLMQYAVERFLFRLSKSDLASKFVLKGALLFRAWSGELHRPTRDLDLLGRGEPTLSGVIEAIRRILATQVTDDGLTFDADTVSAMEIREERDYGGIRAKLSAKLESARIPMQVDVGFGDAITPPARVGSYPTLLDHEAPRMRMYPPETVVAEKLEAAVARGMTNSRMKDYYDLLVIFRTFDLADSNLARAIAATFRRRRTELPDEEPPGLSDAFGNDDGAQRLWREFLRRQRIEDAPPELSHVVQMIRTRLRPAIVEAGKSAAT